jgi:TRAP-type C4-dicarboxylate transport system permease small subunit
MRCISFVTNAAAAVLVLAVLSAVFVRYFGLFGGSLHWIDELSRYLTIWTVMLGSAVALDRGAHVTVGLLPQALSERWRRWMAAASFLISGTFLLVLTWQGFVLARFTMRQLTPALGLPMGYVYLAVGCGGALMCLQSVLFAIRPELQKNDFSEQAID